MTYQPEQHHRKSIRLREYDYSSAGAYFITICTWQRECLFGVIDDGKMQPNDSGKTINSIWTTLPEHYANIGIDLHVVMPNHFHGIINIIPAEKTPDEPDEQGAINRAPTVGEIIRGFKARCTHKINQLQNKRGGYLWQRNYFERVIRNEHELATIRTYIDNNPTQWDTDQYNQPPP